MKKTSLTLFALLLLSVAGYTQGFYFRAGLGYAFPQAGQTMYDTPIPYNGFPTGYSGTRNNNSSQSFTYNIKGASFSSGMQGVIGLGYMFSRNAGVQLDACIGISNAKYTFSDDNVNLGTAASPLPGTISTIQQAKTPVLLMPSLVLQTGGDKLNLYSRFGIALPLNTKVTQEQIISNSPGTGAIVVDDYTWQIKSSFSLGFTAAAGLKYKISDAVSIWGELSLLSMSVYTKEQDLKTLTENGQSLPLSYYTYPQNIKFGKTATFDTTYGNFPTYAQPFSNIGINVGVNISLSGHSRHRMGGENNSETPNRPTGPYRRR